MVAILVELGDRDSVGRGSRVPCSASYARSGYTGVHSITIYILPIFIFHIQIDSFFIYEMFYNF